MSENTHLQLVTNEKTPTNRKEIYLMWEKELSKAIIRKDVKGQIKCIKYQIQIALPEIPEKEYDKTKLDKCKPNYRECKREFMRNIKILIPELEIGLINQINNYVDETYLLNLEKEREEIIKLVKENTNWYFDEKFKKTITK